jgi:RNA polymerase sigma factor (sigma-70 family)
MEDYKELSDEALLLQYKQTLDKKWVGVLYKRYAHLVLGVCYKYFRDKDDSKDAVIRIFEKLFDELQKREINYFKGWLTFVTRNFCISELRKKIVEADRRNEFLKDLTEAEEEKEPDQKEIRYTQLEQAIENLPDKQKLCIQLFYFDNKSYDEISIDTGYTANEVKSYIQNGKRNLKNYLSSQ